MKSRFLRSAALSTLLALVACLVQVACGGDDSAVKENVDSGGPTNPIDSGKPGTDGGADAGDSGDAAPSDCFLNPTTHFEIINACTTATKITKNPVLSKLLPDGGLPPLN